MKRKKGVGGSLRRSCPGSQSAHPFGDDGIVLPAMTNPRGKLLGGQVIILLTWLQHWRRTGIEQLCSDGVGGLH